MARDYYVNVKQKKKRKTKQKLKKRKHMLRKTKHLGNHCESILVKMRMCTLWMQRLVATLDVT